MSTKTTGDYGEKLACEYLQKQGFKILQTHFLIRGGEIDIIAMDGEYLVFVEVKTRLTHEYGLPVESMTKWKINHLLRSAQFYIQKIDWGNKPYRLDFIGIDFADSKDHPKIELIKNITE